MVDKLGYPRELLRTFSTNQKYKLFLAETSYADFLAEAKEKRMGRVPMTPEQLYRTDAIQAAMRRSELQKKTFAENKKIGKVKTTTALADARVSDSEARRQAEQEAERKSREDEQLKAERVAAEKRKVEEEARKAADELAKKRAEQEAARRLEPHPAASCPPKRRAAGWRTKRKKKAPPRRSAASWCPPRRLRPRKSPKANAAAAS